MALASDCARRIGAEIGVGVGGVVEAQHDLERAFRRRQPSEILWRGQAIRLTALHAGSRAAVVTTSSKFQNQTLNTNDVRRLTDIQLTETENYRVRELLIEQFARELHQRLMEMF